VRRVPGWLASVCARSQPPGQAATARARSATRAGRDADDVHDHPVYDEYARRFTRASGDVFAGPSGDVFAGPSDDVLATSDGDDDDVGDCRLPGLNRADCYRRAPAGADERGPRATVASAALCDDHADDICGSRIGRGQPQRASALE
jgi:hypothetical protein